MNNIFPVSKARSHSRTRSLFGRMSIGAMVILALLGGPTSLILLKKIRADTAADLTSDYTSLNAQGPPRVVKGQWQADIRTELPLFAGLPIWNPSIYQADPLRQTLDRLVASCRLAGGRQATPLEAPELLKDQ